MTHKAIIHVGFPKTATTTLQAQFFSCHPELNYLGIPFHNDAAVALLHYVKDTEEAAYDSAVAQALFDEAAGTFDNASKTFAISDEDLTSYEFADRITMVRRLQDIFGMVKIIVSIRHQLHQIESYYFQALKWYLRPGGVEVPFKNFLEDTFAMPRISPVHNVRYFDLLCGYERLAGRDNLMVMLYEDFKADNAKGIEDIAAFAGIAPLPGAVSAETAVNLRIAGNAVAYKKFRKFFLPNAQLSRWVPAPVAGALHGLLNRSKPAIVDWDDTTKTELWDFFKEDNRKLAEHFGLDLARHQYPLP